MNSRLKSNSNLPWFVLGLFALVVAALGGSSRPDAIQIAALRPLTALMLIPALYFISREQIAKARSLVVLLALLAGWMALQLVPLPAGLWQSLPGREVIAQLDAATGMDGTWRPISLVPSRGWNALFALIVPVTALLIALAMRASPRMLMVIIAAVGLVDAVLGIMQVVDGSKSPLYFYAITNAGSPVGLFANENHSAVFSALVLVLLARLQSLPQAINEPRWLRLCYPPTFLIVLLAVLLSGSRAGLALTAFALLVTVVMVWLGFTASNTDRRQSKVEQWITARPRLLLGVFAGLIAVLLIAFFSAQRAPGVDDIFTQNTFEDLRWKLWPTITQMVQTHFLFGAGFGTFEELYHIYEPSDLLLPVYVNQAHNDWAQIVIEGGLPMVALLALFIAWGVRAVLKAPQTSELYIAKLLFWGSTAAIMCGASVVDYPLRAPLFQAMAVWLVVVLAMEIAPIGNSGSSGKNATRSAGSRGK